MVEFFFLALITTPSIKPSLLEETTPLIAKSEGTADEVVFCAFDITAKVLSKNAKIAPICRVVLFIGLLSLLVSCFNKYYYFLTFCKTSQYP